MLLLKSKILIVKCLMEHSHLEVLCLSYKWLHNELLGSLAGKIAPK